MNHSHPCLTGPPSPAHAAHAESLSSRIGIWLFLFTEALLFGTILIAYAVYLNIHRWDFQAGSRELNKWIGAANTVILLTSSLTMALAIAALERRQRVRSLALLAATLACALAFLVIKSLEWGAKFSHGLRPASQVMQARPPGEQLFYGLYFVLTGLHGLHVLAGGAVILLTMALVRADRIRPGRMAFLENAGLYWHLVDVIWIFLFPLFYLIG